MIAEGTYLGRIRHFVATYLVRPPVVSRETPGAVSSARAPAANRLAGTGLFHVKHRAAKKLEWVTAS